MIHEEQRIQTAIIQYLRLNRYMAFSIPNGINISTKGSREIYRRMGLLSGVSDLCIMLPDGKILWIEVKTSKGRQSEEQKAFEAAAIRLKHDYRVWRSVDDAIRFVEERKSNETLSKNE